MGAFVRGGLATEVYAAAQAAAAQAAAIAAGFGQGQTVQNVTASRALGVTYTNTSGKPIQIALLILQSAGGNASFWVNGVQIGAKSNTGGTAGYQDLGLLIIPDGATYMALNGVGTSLTYWSELR